MLAAFSGSWHSLVDLGAGDGATTAHVAHLFEKVYATDISAPMRWTLAKRKFTVLDVEKWYEKWTVQRYPLLEFIRPMRPT